MKTLIGILFVAILISCGCAHTHEIVGQPTPVNHRTEDLNVAPRWTTPTRRADNAMQEK
jgi:hypothetical protein